MFLPKTRCSEGNGTKRVLGKLRRKVMKRWLCIGCLVLLGLGNNAFSFNEKDPYENFRLSIFEQIIAGEVHINGEDKKTEALKVMRKLKTGKSF